ncbi:MAG: hydantoinase B/oxoprolinase family protein [Chloroflexota bacterium]
MTVSGTPPLVDALSLQIFANLFSSVAEEMGVTLQQASFSPNIKMRRDYSCALFDEFGRLLAQAAHIPVHLGAMPLAMRTVRERFDLQPGDVVILNDPFAGGTHLPDVSLVSAAFARDGQRLGYVMSRAHHADIGGMAAGSMPLSTEIYQEGMIIPPILLVSAGHQNQELMELILRNVRTPSERRGDFAAQMAAQHVGEEALSSLADRYGAGSLSAHGGALQDYSEAMMRELIAHIPPGEYGFEDALDDDGFESGPVPIRAMVRRRSETTDLEIDLSGSAVQCRGPVNAVEAVTHSAALYVMRCLQGEDAPVNEGSMRPLTIRTLPGTVVAAESPAAVAAGNVETSQRIVDTLFGALAKALPHRVPAASQGTMNNVAFGGWDSVRHRPFAYYETMGGGMGGRPGGSGMDGVHDHMSNTLNTPVEVLESEFPVMVVRYSLRNGTGGAGAHAGGAGLRRDLQFMEYAEVTLVTERRVGVPYGIAGGQSGSTGMNTLTHDGVETTLRGKESFRVEPGDIVSVQSPGGGGWGMLPGEHHGW